MRQGLLSSRGAGDVFSSDRCRYVLRRERVDRERFTGRGFPNFPVDYWQSVPRFPSMLLAKGSHVP